MCECIKYGTPPKCKCTKEVTFDPKWPHGHVTRDGKKATVLKTDLANNTRPLVVVVMNTDNEEIAISYPPKGNYWLDGSTSGWDILNAPIPKKKMKVAVIVYQVPYMKTVTVTVAREDQNLFDLKYWSAQYKDHKILSRTEIEVEYVENV
jgi:hypothetical protein